MPEPTQATVFLDALAAGDRAAADRLMPLVYEDLRAIAASYFVRETPGHTLQPTALVHEAFVKLIDQTRVHYQSRAHFCATAATAMRRILVDHARQRNADKRGGSRQRITLSGIDAAIAKSSSTNNGIDVEALDEALTELATLDERQARVVEMRFFAGMSVDETAEALGVSDKTVKNDWRFARAWLHDRLSKAD